jgi:hypothetical protein
MPAFEQDAADAVLVAPPLLEAVPVPVLAGAVAVLELMLEQAVSSPRPTAAAAASVLCRILIPSPASGSRLANLRR